VLRQQRLDDRFATALSASGTARDLRQQLEGALVRTKVREAQSDVRGDHTHQRDLGKVVALRDHLRAD